jgi:hypothetical protein
MGLREKPTPWGRLERQIANCRKEKLRRARLARPNDAAAAIIPFPREPAQAADGSADPSSGT